MWLLSPCVIWLVHSPSPNSPARVAFSMLCCSSAWNAQLPPLAWLTPFRPLDPSPNLTSSGKPSWVTQILPCDVLISPVTAHILHLFGEYLVIAFSSSSYKLHKRKDHVSLCLLYPECIVQCLAHEKNLNICSLNEWIDEYSVFKNFLWRWHNGEKSPLFFVHR